MITMEWYHYSLMTLCEGYRYMLDERVLYEMQRQTEYELNH